MLRTIGRICYALGLASIFLSLGSQWRMGTAKANMNRFMRGKPSDPRSERMSIFFGLWAPTFFITGKILEDLGRETDMAGGMQGSFGGQASATANGYNQAAERAMSGAR
jgi:hypothetical protein